MAIFGISFKDNKEQAELVRQIMDKNQPIIFGIGKAGTGKNFAALACALHLQEEREYSEIYYARNPVQCGEDMGYLPGGIEEKYEPFMRPLVATCKGIVRTSAYYEKRNKETKNNAIKNLLERIEMVPIAFLRGDTFEDVVVIVDECQNLDWNDLRTIMTRLGNYAKLVLLGSFNQIDNEKQQKKVRLTGKCDFQRVVEWFTENCPDFCGSVELIKSMRSPLCVRIDEAFDEIDFNN